MKYHLHTAVIGITLALLGAGCAQTPEGAQTPASNFSMENISSLLGLPAEEAPAQPPAESVSLSAEALGNGAVKFIWTTDKALSDANRFIITRSDKENPEHDGKNFWARFFYTKREAVWDAQPSGVLHYRICLTDNKKHDPCELYSNDVAVEVK